MKPRHLVIVLVAAGAALLIEMCASQLSPRPSYPALVLAGSTTPTAGEPTYRLEYEYDDGTAHHHESVECTQREYMEFYMGAKEMCVTPMANRNVRLEECK